MWLGGPISQQASFPRSSDERRRGGVVLHGLFSHLFLFSQRGATIQKNGTSLLFCSFLLLVVNVEVLEFV